MTKPTIKDVAEKAGVSKSTVSQFLNQRYSYMSEATRKKIARVIHELNYHPNQIAKSLKQKDTRLIALICSTLSSRFSLELVRAIENFFQAQNYSVVVTSTEDDSTREQELIESFVARQIDGLLVFPTFKNKAIYQELQDRKTPLVFIDRDIPGLTVPSVLLDNQQVAIDATQLLIDYGHHDIAIITFPLGDHITTRVERLNGYKKTLRKNKIIEHPAFMITCLQDEVGQKLEELFQQKQQPSAILATNDMILEAILIWAKERKMAIPDTFSLVGIDEVSFARLYTPEITTFAQPVEAIGTKASELLLQQIQGEEGLTNDKNKYRYPTQLNERESIKKI